MAFQANAYQSDAFQICASTKPDIALLRRKRRWLEDKAQEELRAAREFLKKAKEESKGFKDVEGYREKLEGVLAPYIEQEDINLKALLEQKRARIRLQQILTSIRQLEDELLQILALLLLANEEL